MQSLCSLASLLYLHVQIGNHRTPLVPCLGEGWAVLLVRRWGATLGQEVGFAWAWLIPPPHIHTHSLAHLSSVLFSSCYGGSLLVAEANAHFRQLLRRMRVAELLGFAGRDAGVHGEGRRPDG